VLRGCVSGCVRCPGPLACVLGVPSFEHARNANGTNVTFLLDEALDIRIFESFPGLRDALREFWRTLCESPNRFVLTTRFVARSLRLFRDASERFEFVLMPPLSVTEAMRTITELNLGKTKSGDPVVRKTKRNLMLILQADTRWKGRLWMDSFRRRLMYEQRDYTDSDDTRILMWVERVYGVEYPAKTVCEVATVVGEAIEFNPLVSWLESLEWDGIVRTDQWLIQAAGAEDTEINRKVGRAWLIQAIARAMKLVGALSKASSAIIPARSQPSFVGVKKLTPDTERSCSSVISSKFLPSAFSASSVATRRRTLIEIWMTL